MAVKQRTMIEKSKRVLIFVNYGCRHFARHNSTEQTVHQPIPSCALKNFTTKARKTQNDRAFGLGGKKLSAHSIKTGPDKVSRRWKAFFQTLTQTLELKNQRHNRSGTLRQRYLHQPTRRNRSFNTDQ